MKAMKTTSAQFALSFLALLSGLSPVAHSGDADYCAIAQQRMVDTELAVINQKHGSFDSFVKSKPAAKPLTTQQYSARFRFPRKQVELWGSVSCKFKSADALIAIHGADKVGEQLSCRALVRDRIHALLSELGPAAQLTSEDIIVRKDDRALIGPSWLRPWPYSFVSQNTAGKLEIGAKALRAAYKSLAPIPAAFKGTYNCHLPHDEYLRALLTGQLSAEDTPTLVNQVDARRKNERHRQLRIRLAAQSVNGNQGAYPGSGNSVFHVIILSGSALALPHH